ncbi:MAG: hypothetical protein ACRED0_05245 [Gammaproteobacteria bacterium]
MALPQNLRVVSLTRPASGLGTWATKRGWGGYRLWVLNTRGCHRAAQGFAGRSRRRPAPHGREALPLAGLVKDVAAYGGTTVLRKSHISQKPPNKVRRQ